MKSRITVVFLLVFSSTVMATESPPVITCRMGSDVQSSLVTKEQLALVIEIRDQLEFPVTMLDGDVGVLTFDEKSLKYRTVSDPDGASFLIRIRGVPVAEGISEYSASIEYLGPNRGRSTKKADFGEFSSFVKADHVHVIGEGRKVLDWAVVEITAFMKRESKADPDTTEVDGDY